MSGLRRAESSFVPPRAPRPARRAKIACKACNVRRVKCDATDSQPCWNCKMRGQPCELIESRRGRYPRTRARPKSTGGDPSEGSTACEQDTSVREASAHSHREQMSETSTCEVAQPTLSPTSSFKPTTRPTASTTSADGPEMLFARMSEVPPPAAESPSDLLAQTRTFYLGETFSLAFVVKTVCSPSDSRDDEVRHHYPIPASVPDRLERRDDSVRSFLQDQETFLGSQGALTLPKNELSDAMLAVFFKYFHPAWPVFDRRLLLTLYERNQASLLALHTIYFIAVSICDEELLSRIGFNDRYQARRVFYLRAKGLYDADYEKDKTILAAVLLLLGFWWQGPEDQKDTWHWVGCAVSLVQTLGMHRSTARSGITPRQRSLWKRIFWSVYARDRHAAAALGRPPRIHDDDCDVEGLTPDDFAVDVTPESQIIPTQMTWEVQYPIAMSTLAVIFGKVIRSRYAPRRHGTKVDHKSIGDDLVRWKENLPREMYLEGVEEAGGPGFWACMLHASFYTCQILWYRPNRVMVDTPEEVQDDRVARAAADGMTRIAEDLLASGTIRQGQVHLAPALFAACGMLAIIVRRGNAIQSQLAENRARQCMLALSELARSWPVAGWIFRLFVSLMTRLTGHEIDVGAKLTGAAAGAIVHSQQVGSENTEGGAQLHANGHMGNLGTQALGVDQSLLPMNESVGLWPNDLDWEGFDGIFQDALDGFSLYDFSLPGEPYNFAART